MALRGCKFENRWSVGSHLSFQRLTWCPVWPRRIQGRTDGSGSSVCVLNPTSPSSISGAPSRPGSPSKSPFFCPVPLGRAAPNIYAKSTSPNCKISLQTKFFLSPLPTAVNYKSGGGVVWVWVTARRGDLEARRKEKRKKKKEPGNISSYITDTHNKHTHAHRRIRLFSEDLPDYSKSLLRWSLWWGFAVMKAWIRAVTNTLSKSQWDQFPSSPDV